MTPTPRRQHHLPELLEIHADELAYLWGQRCSALWDVRYTQSSFIELNERIEAHVAGLLTVPSALPALLGKRLLDTDDRDDAFAAAYGLLRLVNPALMARVVEVFAVADGPRLLGLRDALATAPLGVSEPALQAVLAQGHPARALAAAAVLAQHGRLQAEDVHFTRWLVDPDAKVADLAWQALMRVDARLAATPDGAPPRPYKPALQRPDKALHATVFGAAAWSVQPWLLRALHHEAERGDPAALGWLAALGGPDDWPALQAALAALPALQRPPLLARFGHPVVLPLLVEAMQGADPHLASAACAAFSRVSGEDVRGGRTTPPPREGADEFEREMAMPLWLPDLVKVEQWLKTHADGLAAPARWNRGLQLSDAPSRETLARIDLPARWDACARSAAGGRTIGQPPPVC